MGCRIDFVVEYLSFPHQFAGLRIERKYVIVVTGIDDQVANLVVAQLLFLVMPCFDFILK